MKNINHNKVWKSAKRLFQALILTSLPLFSAACSRNENPVIIWTDRAEFASCMELFNSSHENTKVVVIYKEMPSRSLPPSKDEDVPDIIIGSWLKNSRTRKEFSQIDYLFSEGALKKSDFYTKLLEYGSVSSRQYLLPVSFNLPQVIFSKKNESLVNDDHILSLDDIKTAAGSFNSKNKNNSYTAMGYGPSWDREFIYLVSKIYGTDYREKGNSFSWNQKALDASMAYLKEWTRARNTDTETEQNFQFKYLYMPKERQVTENRSLFAFMESDVFFKLGEQKSENISYRWVCQEGKIPVEDSIVTLGLYKHGKNTKEAEKFISWFFKEESQRALIERREKMNLDTNSFGIAGGFSSIRSVTEKVYPAFYRQLRENLIPADMLVTPNILPGRWNSLMEQVIYPYLQENVNTLTLKEIPSMEKRIAEWSKQYY